MKAKKNLKKNREKIPAKKIAVKKAKPRKLGDNPCTHEKKKGYFPITVLGCKVKLKSSDMCPTCLQAYLEKNSTICNSCERPIFPGDPVAGTGLGKRAKHKYTHGDNTGCCVSGGLFCGHWGEGELIPFSSL